MAVLEEMLPKQECRTARPVQSSTDSNERSNEDTDTSFNYNAALHDKTPAAAVSKTMNTSCHKRPSKRSKFDTD